MLLYKTKLVKPGFINIGCGGGRGWLLEWNIEGVVGKVTPSFKDSQPFLSKIVALVIAVEGPLLGIWGCAKIVS